MRHRESTTPAGCREPDDEVARIKLYRVRQRINVELINCIDRRGDCGEIYVIDVHCTANICADHQSDRCARWQVLGRSEIH